MGASLFGQSVCSASEERLVLEAFEVTGSRIPRADTEGMAPLALFDREDIERSGASTINEFFRDMVFSSAGIIDEQFTQGFAPGTSGIDLRGLGVNRTLVLLDGRRLPVYPFGQEGTQSFVDINGIPLAAIERIEILKDGASAIYGADAVAGVVNIITRRDMEGFEGTVQLGMTGEGDGEEGRLSAVAGKRWEKTSATVIVDYLDRQAIMAKDRDISSSAKGPIDDSGSVQMAVGAEVRREEFHDEFDERTENGEILGIGGVSAEGDRDLQSAYAELSIPATDALEIQLAGRFDHYSDFGGTFNPKLGLRWQPRSDFLLRASAGTGFKAPALHELYSGTIEGFETLLDDGTLVNDLPTRINGNPDLEAEESQSLNLGFVWDITRRWNLGIDGWYLKNENAVTNDPQYILDNEAQFPNLIVRDGSGTLVSIESPFQNIAAQKLWGVDLDTHVDRVIEHAGDFRFGIVASYLGAFKEEAVEGDGFEDLAGEDGRPRIRSQGSIGWNKSAYAGSIAANYIGGYDRLDVDDPEFDSIDSWTMVDAQFNWSLRAIAGGTITLGVENLFDTEPPEDPFFEGWPFINRALHNPRGRFGYLSYKHKF